MRTKTKTKNRVYSGIFKKYVHALPQLILSNLMFAIPMVISLAVVWVLGGLTDSIILVFIRFLPVFLLMPFYCGLCKVTKDVFIGKEIRGVRDYLKAVRDNLKYSVLHGFIFYIVALVDYFADVFYYQAATYNSAMYVVFGLCVAVTVLTVFCFFFVPLITVTLDIKFKYIYKNAALMSIGELPKNLLAALSCVCCIAVATTLFALTGNYYSAVVFIAILLIVILPVTIAYFINGILYPSVDKLLISKSDENAKDKTSADAHSLLREHLEENPIDPAILEGDENELVFYDGKMIKRSKLIEMYKSINE